MPVAHRRVGDEQPVLVGHPARHGLGPAALEDLARALRRALGPGRARGPQIVRRPRAALRLGVPVHGHLADVAQELRRPVLARLEIEELGRRVDEARRVLVRAEGRVAQQVLDEGDVGRHAPDAELAQRPVHARDGGLRRGCPGRDLLQKRVVVARDDGARVGRAAVEADAHARGAAIGRDAAVVGDEGVGRVLGGDPALDRVAVEVDVVLGRDARGLHQRAALGDQDLRAHDVDAGDLLGHGVLDLDAGVHLDEEELARLHVLQELDGAGVHVAHRLGDLAAEPADLLALSVGEVGGRRALHDLLVAPLHGAVALVEVVDVALRVAEDLHLDVARPLDDALEIAFARAERRLGLAPALEHLGLELVGAVHPTHPAPAAAPGGLEHQRVADGLGLGADRLHVLAQHARRGDHGNLGLDRDLPGRCLVPEAAHDLGRRPDEGDPGPGHRVDEVRPLGQEPVARMDHVGAAGLGDSHDLLDREVGGDGSEPLADAVGLVGLEAVEPELVLLGVDRDRAVAELVGGAHDADRDLAAVGDEDLPAGAVVGHGAPLRCGRSISRRRAWHRQCGVGGRAPPARTEGTLHTHNEGSAPETGCVAMRFIGRTARRRKGGKFPPVASGSCGARASRDTKGPGTEGERGLPRHDPRV